MSLLLGAYTLLKTLLNLKLIISCLAAVCLISGCASSSTSLLVRLEDWQEIELGQMAAELGEMNLVCIGELHDQMSHHKTGLGIIRALHEAGFDLAIGMEMFTYDEQPVLDRWLDGRLDWPAMAAAYQRNWKQPVAMYEEIFLYAGRNGIPLLGFNVPKNIIGKVARQGFDGLTEFEKGNLPNDISCEEDLPQMVLLKELKLIRLRKVMQFFA